VARTEAERATSCVRISEGSFVSFSRSDRRIGWLLVIVQGALLLIVFAGPRPTNTTTSASLDRAGFILRILGIGLILVSAVELGRRLTAHPEPNGRGTLRRSGLYRLVRHPMYSGVMALSLGSVLTAPSTSRVVACVALVVLFNVKARFEERSLTQHFPDYAEYASHTSRFVPIAFLRRKHHE
jgi:protein-S-isoprenylcysteine O-methyltransferase Ste14